MQHRECLDKRGEGEAHVVIEGDVTVQVASGTLQKGGSICTSEDTVLHISAVFLNASLSVGRDLL